MRKMTMARVLHAIVAIVVVSVVWGLALSIVTAIFAFRAIALQGTATPAVVISVPPAWLVAGPTAIVFSIVCLRDAANERRRRRDERERNSEA